MRRMKPVIQIYDSEEDVLRTLATAEKEGHLTETIIEEFVNIPIVTSIFVCNINVCNIFF